MAEPLRCDDDADEHTLIRRIVDGAAEEYEVLVRRYQEMVYHLIRRQVGDEGAARELAQDSFIRAFEALKTFRGDSTFRTWLIRIALNVTNSYFSSRRFKESQRNVSFVPEAHDQSVAPDDGSAREEINLMRRALASLPQKYREVVVLLSLEGHPHAAVAQMLGIPVGTVCSRYNTAVELLKKKIGAVL